MLTIFRPRITLRVTYCLWYVVELYSIKLTYMREACSKILPLLIQPLEGKVFYRSCCCLP